MDDDPRDEDDEEPTDPIPGLIASIDQMLAIMPQQARAAHGIYTEMLDVGFDGDDALTITLEYVRSWL